MLPTSTKPKRSWRKGDRIDVATFQRIVNFVESFRVVSGGSFSFNGASAKLECYGSAGYGTPWFASYDGANVNIGQGYAYWWSATDAAYIGGGYSSTGTLTLPAADKFRAYYLCLTITADDDVAWTIDETDDEDSEALAITAALALNTQAVRTWVICTANDAGILTGSQKIGLGAVYETRGS